VTNIPAAFAPTSAEMDAPALLVTVPPAKRLAPSSSVATMLPKF
jgi:hypothetical protein